MKTARDEMTRKVTYVLETDDITQAYEAMMALGISHIPVLKQDKLVGILSDRDVLAHAHPQNPHAKSPVEVPKLKVSAVMTEKVIGCLPTTSIGTVADLMLEHRIHCLPVVTPTGALVGIITSSDLIRLLRDRSWDLEDEIPYQFEEPTQLAASARLQ